jgi:hypothetical protein
MRNLHSLRAVKPQRCRDVDDEIFEDEPSVVCGVELVEACIEAACFWGAGSEEIGLCDRVVCGVEVEADYVAD